MQVLDPYISRLDSPADAAVEAVARQDPVVWPAEYEDGHVPSPLDAGIVELFGRQGFLFRDQWFTSEETAPLYEEALRLAETADRKAPGVISEPGDDAVVRSVFRVHLNSPAFRAVCQDARLVDAARQLLGGGVYIHQSRINYKPPLDGKEFFWHSDFETWHMEDGMPRMRAVSVSLCLTDNHEFNGPLMVVPRSHELYVRCQGATPQDHFQQSLKKQQYGVPSRRALEMLVERGGIAAPKGLAGSALFFECNTMHGSVGNLSPWPRINLFVVYNSVHNRLEQPFSGQPPRPEYLAERP